MADPPQAEGIAERLAAREREVERLRSLVEDQAHIKKEAREHMEAMQRTLREEFEQHAQSLHRAAQDQVDAAHHYARLLSQAARKDNSKLTALFHALAYAHHRTEVEGKAALAAKDREIESEAAETAARTAQLDQMRHAIHRARAEMDTHLSARDAMVRAREEETAAVVRILTNTLEEVEATANNSAGWQRTLEAKAAHAEAKLRAVQLALDEQQSTLWTHKEATMVHAARSHVLTDALATADEDLAHTDAMFTTVARDLREAHGRREDEVDTLACRVASLEAEVAALDMAMTEAAVKAYETASRDSRDLHQRCAELRGVRAPARGAPLSTGQTHAYCAHTCAPRLQEADASKAQALAWQALCEKLVALVAKVTHSPGLADVAVGDASVLLRRTLAALQGHHHPDDSGKLRSLHNTVRSLTASLAAARREADAQASRAARAASESAEAHARLEKVTSDIETVLGGTSLRALSSGAPEPSPVLPSMEQTACDRCIACGAPALTPGIANLLREKKSRPTTSSGAAPAVWGPASRGKHPGTGPPGTLALGTNVGLGPSRSAHSLLPLPRDAASGSRAGPASLPPSHWLLHRPRTQATGR